MNSTNDPYQEAQEWQVILWSGEVTEQEQTSFNAWLNSNPEHLQAWHKLQQMNQPLAEVPEAIASSVLRSPIDKGRRKILGTLGLFLAIGALSYQIPRTRQWQIATADFTTKKGEQITTLLPDGTKLTLNTDSAVSLEFTQTVRRIYLHQGEILITTAPDNKQITNRPFIVETLAGEVRPIGTQFIVSWLHDNNHASIASAQVNVFEGAVELYPRLLSSGQNSGQRVNASQKTTFSANAAKQPTEITTRDGAWLKGLLVAERQTLGEFIQELSRYHLGILRCDPAIKDLIISGVYSISDTDAVLKSLASALPIRIRAITPYWVTLIPENT
ncbi:MAG: FecR family protein [Pseudomonadota bacterium]